MNNGKRGKIWIIVAAILGLVAVTGVVYSMTISELLWDMVWFSVLAGMAFLCFAYGINTIDTYNAEVWKQEEINRFSEDMKTFVPNVYSLRV